MCEAEKNLSFELMYKKLETLITSKIEELKAEILQNQNNKYKVIKDKLIAVERKIRKNNIVIFGTTFDSNIVDNVLKIFNEVIGVNIQESDLNNIYKLGKKNVIIVEFLSYLKKQAIFRNLKKLKGIGITITDDLCPEDQDIKKKLVKQMKEARSKNQKAYIRNNRLYINDEIVHYKELNESITINASNPEVSEASDNDSYTQTAECELEDSDGEAGCSNNTILEKKRKQPARKARYPYKRAIRLSDVKQGKPRK